MKVEDVLVTKGHVSKSVARSAVQAGDKERLPAWSLLLASGAIDEQKIKDALVLPDEELEEFKDPVLFLKRTPLFNQINDKAVRQIAATVSWEWFPQGHVIIGQGFKAADFHIIQGGRVRVCIGEGESETTLAVLSRGDCFGEMSLLSGGLTTATVKATEPTLCLKQGQGRFLEMINRYPVLHHYFSRLVVERVRTIYKELILDGSPFPRPLPSSSPSGQAARERPVMVFTLGQFELIRKGTPIVFEGKAQKKPLLLLKALICLGGRQVGEGAVTELLWPDSEGDAAHSAFSTTLSRLRSLLGSQNAIEVSEGRARINPDCVWIDIWEFDHLCTQAEEPWNESTSSPAVDAMQKAVRLYKGHFLPSEEHFWALSVRENLRSRYLRLVSKLGDLLEGRNDLESALQWYERALEIDDLVEEFYQRLIGGYQQRGCKAEAIAVYERCARRFATEFGITPSNKTLAMVGKIKSDKK